MKHGNLVTAAFLNINAAKLVAQFTLSYVSASGISRLYLQPVLLVFNLNVLVQTPTPRVNIRRLGIGLRCKLGRRFALEWAEGR